MKIVIIGNGIAGVSAAETIRADDKGCAIAVVSDESYPLYARPRLTEFLAGKASIEQITIRAPAWYEKNALDLKLSTRVTRIATEQKQVFCAGGETLCYDTLVIAAGASSLVPPVPGFDSEGIFTLRTAADAEKVRAAATAGKSAVVVGGGLLGIELAGGLSASGVRVQVIEKSDRLLPRQLDGESSAFAQKLFEKKGIAFLVGRTIVSAEKGAGGFRISCNDGKETAADFIVISSGISPNVSVIEGTAVERRQGIVVDGRMRTSVEHVFACGDVAEYGGGLCGLWQDAREQGMVCGARILGKEAVYGGTVHSARLKAAGVALASIGDVERREGIREITEKDEAAGHFRKYFVRGDTLRGAILVGDIKEEAALRRAIENGDSVAR